MKEIDLEKIEKNYRKLLVDLYRINYVDFSAKKFENYISMAKDIINKWPFAKLDDYFENGLKKNDTSLLNNDMWSVTVGYALITRYNLGLKKYLNWCKKQEIGYIGNLLKLVDVEIPELREKIIKAESDKLAQIRILKINQLDKLINERHAVIEFSNKSTKYTILGKPICINDEAKELVGFYKVLGEAKVYMATILQNGFRQRCRDYKECYKNLGSVFIDSIDAGWIKCKKYLEKEDIEDTKIDEMEGQVNEFKEAAVSAWRNRSDEVLQQIFSAVEGKVNDIQRRDLEKRSREYIGGGYGIKGAVAGMVGAGILNALNDVWVSSATSSSMNRLIQDVQNDLNTIFVGEEAQKNLIGLIDNFAAFLEALLVSNLFHDKFEVQSDIDSVLDYYYGIEDILSAENKRNYIIKIFFLYPRNISIYELLLSTFMNVRYEVEKIGKLFGLEADIKKIPSRFIMRDSKCIIYSDMYLDLVDDNLVEFRTLEYEGKRYMVFVPMKTTFFDNSWRVYFDTSINRDCCMLNEKTGDVIKYWGGKEGKKTFLIEKNQNNEQILARVNQFKNINILDYSQQVILNPSEDCYIQILHAEMLYDGKNDVYMWTYADPDVYFSICIGRKKTMGRDEEYFSEIAKGIKVIKCNASNKIKYLTDQEVKQESFDMKPRESKEEELIHYYKKERLQKEKLKKEKKEQERERRQQEQEEKERLKKERLQKEQEKQIRLKQERKKIAEEYIQKSRSKEDQEFAQIFKDRFNTIMPSIQQNEVKIDFIINKYDYDVNDKEILDILKQEEEKGQFIIFYNRILLITDYNIYVCGTKYRIQDIEDFLYYRNIMQQGYAEEMIAVRSKGTTYYHKFEGVQATDIIADNINIVLGSIKKDNYASNYLNYSLLCDVCKSNHVVQGLFRYGCKACGNKDQKKLFEHPKFVRVKYIERIQKYMGNES